MNDPGLMSTQGQAGSTSMLTPEYLQQMQAWQDNQRKQALAQSLMSNQADPRTQNSGIANAGADIAGALASKAVANRMNPLAQVQVTPQQIGGGAGIWAQRHLGNLFNLGGG